MQEETSAKELAGEILNDALELTGKGIEAAKAKLKEVDVEKITTKIKASSEKLAGFSMTSTKFLVLYLLFMVPTYFVRYAAIAAVFKQAEKHSSAGSIGIVANFLLFVFLLALCFIAYLRGKVVEKKHLVAFPTVALVFDLLLPFIPLVPTVMHTITLVVGLPEAKKETSI